MIVTKDIDYETIKKNYETKECTYSSGFTYEYVHWKELWFELSRTDKEGKKEISINTRVWDILNNYLNKAWRVRMWYGSEDGTSWLDEYDAKGTVGRTTGEIKEPILIPTKRSLGGMCVLTSRIIRIDDIDEKRTLWKHENFHLPSMHVKYGETDCKELPYGIFTDDGINVANFTTEVKAYNWLAFMEGKRYKA